MTIGESLDGHFGKLIPHAMLAAAFGNWFSDLFGLATGERVENWMGNKYPAPKLTFEQTQSKEYHNSKHGGRAIGITVGCLVGAICALPFLDLEMPDEEYEKIYGHEKSKEYKDCEMIVKLKL